MCIRDRGRGIIYGDIISNTAPVLAAISNWTVNAGQTVAFTAGVTDTDAPPQTLTFSLLRDVYKRQVKGLVCLPSDNLLHELVLNKDGSAFKLANDPLAGKATWNLRPAAKVE